MDYADIFDLKPGESLEYSDIMHLLDRLHRLAEALPTDDSRDLRRRFKLLRDTVEIKNIVSLYHDKGNYAGCIDRLKQLFEELDTLKKRHAIREKYSAIHEATKMQEIVYSIDGTPYEKLLQSISYEFEHREHSCYLSNLLMPLVQEEKLISYELLDITFVLGSRCNLYTPWGMEFPIYILLGYYGQWLSDNIQDSKILIHTMHKMVDGLRLLKHGDYLYNLLNITTFPKLFGGITPHIFSLLGITSIQYFADMDADDFCYTFTDLIKTKLNTFNITENTFLKLQMIGGNTYRGMPLVPAVCIQVLKDAMMIGGDKLERP